MLSYVFTLEIITKKCTQVVCSDVFSTPSTGKKNNSCGQSIFFIITTEYFPPNTSCRTKQIPTLMQAPETQSYIGKKGGYFFSWEPKKLILLMRKVSDYSARSVAIIFFLCVFFCVSVSLHTFISILKHCMHHHELKIV